MTTNYRLFIAVELPEPVIEALINVQDHLQAASPIRWVKPEQMHLTLQFLGDTPPARVDPLVAALAERVPANPPFSLKVGGLGVFPNLKRPRVIWVGLEDQAKALQKLHAAVIEATQTVGFAPEDRPFTGHLTLGRTNKRATSRDYAQISRVIQDGQDKIGFLATLPVDHVSLIRSQLKPAGSVYTTLARIELEREA